MNNISTDIQKNQAHSKGLGTFKRATNASGARWPRQASPKADPLSPEEVIYG